jgi:hypothetical protein
MENGALLLPLPWTKTPYYAPALDEGSLLLPYHGRRLAPPLRWTTAPCTTPVMDAGALLRLCHGRWRPTLLVFKQPCHAPRIVKTRWQKRSATWEANRKIAIRSRSRVWKRIIFLKNTLHRTVYTYTWRTSPCATCSSYTRGAPAHVPRVVHIPVVREH